MDKVYRKICKRCNANFITDSMNKRLCHQCGNTPEDIAWRAAERKKKKESPLERMLQEIAEYHQKYGTSLSYGQYVSKFGK